jgi:phosphoglycerol transferase MdoB-like AlkP superfamily enzyme
MMKLISSFKKRIELRFKPFKNWCQKRYLVLQKKWRKFAKKFPLTSRAIRKVIRSQNASLIFLGGFLLLAGIFSATYVFWWQFGSLENAQVFIAEHPEIYGYSVLIMLIITALLFGVVGKTFLAAGVLYSLLTVVMFINAEKIKSRNVPFLPDDLAMAGEAGSLGEMVDMSAVLSVLGLIILFIVVSLILHRIFRKIPVYKVPKRAKWLFRILIVAGSATLLSYNTSFLRTELYGKGTTVRVDWLDSTIDFTNPAYNYKTNGFIVGTITGFQSKVQEAPKNYSKEKIDQITQKYTKLANAENQTRENSSEKVNVIYVMSESFIDPAKIKPFYDYGDRDPIPFVRNLMSQQTSGQSVTAEYGGGTANVEFEALTGLSNYFLNTIAYTSMISGNNKTPSLAKTLRQNGYATTAIHPYSGTMYKRNSVYPNLGISNFIDMGSMKHVSKIDNSKYISDESSFKEVLDRMKSTKESDFIHLVTMQNHMPYSGGVYATRNFPVVNIKGSEEDARQWETYLEGISKTDEALQNFIAEIEKSDEKTAIVFWGDHWPGIAGKMADDSEGKQEIQKTPFFIYTNFATEKQELGAISPNYFQAVLMNQLGAKLSPFQKLLLENIKDNTALTKNQKVKQTEALSDYQMIEYDILSGNKFSAGDFFGY